MEEQQLWLVSADGQACFKLRLRVVENILPNIRVTLATISNNSEANLTAIMLEPMRGDVLRKIVEFVRKLASNYLGPDDAKEWKRGYFASMSDELLEDVLHEVERRNDTTRELTHEHMRLLELSLKFQRENRRGQMKLNWKAKLAARFIPDCFKSKRSAHSAKESMLLLPKHNDVPLEVRNRASVSNLRKFKSSGDVIP